MYKTILYVIIGLALLVGGFFLLSSYIYNEKQADTAADYKDATYSIDGKSVQLKNGVSEIEIAPGSASKIVTRYFGNEVRHDLNDDGREDIVFLLTQETGGSGTFYYVVAALDTTEGYSGSEGLLLGDRIAPQTTELSQNPGHKNVIVVNYAVRNPGEPFTTRPSLGKSIWLKLDPGTLQFGEVVQDFEGEADPSKMTLTMKTWTWISALYNDGKTVVPRDTKAFTITFSSEGTFSAKTDCNAVSGKYVVNGEGISFGQMVSTKMYCEGSQESTFTQLLSDTKSFHFTSKGELILDLKFDSGSIVFR